MTTTATVPAPSTPSTAQTGTGLDRVLVAQPDQVPGFVATTLVVAGRTLRQFVRTPQLIVVGALTSAMFLLMFRYVFGGAIETGGVGYADFLISGIAAAGALFSGTGAAPGVAEDEASGLYDRFRSLPVPRSAVLAGRAVADTVLVAWGLLITVVLGFATGFRINGGVPSALAAAGVCVLFGAVCAWPFIWMGLVSGGAQAAQGMSMLVFPFVFVSSAYVPVESMPGWLQPVAEHQPVTLVIGAVRSLVMGDDAAALLGHSTGWYLLRSALWGVAILAVFVPLTTRRFARS